MMSYIIRVFSAPEGFLYAKYSMIVIKFNVSSIHSIVIFFIYFFNGILVLVGKFRNVM